MHFLLLLALVSLSPQTLLCGTMCACCRCLFVITAVHQAGSWQGRAGPWQNIGPIRSYPVSPSLLLHLHHLLLSLHVSLCFGYVGALARPGWGDCQSSLICVAVGKRRWHDSRIVVKDHREKPTPMGVGSRAGDLQKKSDFIIV